MYVKLTIPERLQDLRKERHLTLEQLAEQTGLSKSALGKYETDDYKDISPFAIATLANFYGVSTDYLLGLSENKNHPNAELQALHLSDDMVTLLSSGKINNRLLCELATHSNFQRLMVDMEIFIDRIADMRVDQMNLILEATRQTILDTVDKSVVLWYNEEKRTGVFLHGEQLSTARYVRCDVGNSQAVHNRKQGNVGRERKGYPSISEWRVLDFENGSTMERPAAGIW